MLSYEELVKRTQESYRILDEANIANNNIDQAIIDKFKVYVENCVPAVVGLISDKDWRKLLVKYLKRIKDIRNNPIKFNNCYYLIDFILLLAIESENVTDQEREHTYNLFCAFDNIVSELRTVINSSPELVKKYSSKLNKKIAEAVKTGLAKADDHHNSLFMNFVNEIAFFHLIAMDDNIGLVDMEVPLSNGGDIDFHLIYGGEERLVDTVSIQNLYGPNIDQKLRIKAKDKYDQKTENINDAQILEKIRVAPIIVYDDDRLIDYDPQLPPDEYFPPFLSILEYVDNRHIVNLHKLPLSEMEKDGFRKMMG